MNDDVVYIGDIKFTKEEILDDYSKRMNVIPIFVKVITNYLQVLAIVENFSFDWPDPVEDLLNINVKINLAFLEVFSLDCLLKGTSITSSLQMPTLFAQILLYSLLPIILSLLGAVFWLVTFYIKSRRLKSKRKQMLERYKS